jgi:hypothetical protein
MGDLDRRAARQEPPVSALCFLLNPTGLSPLFNPTRSELSRTISRDLPVPPKKGRRPYPAPTPQRGDKDRMPPLGQTRTGVPRFRLPDIPVDLLQDAIEAMTPLSGAQGTFVRGFPVFQCAIC